MRLHIHLLILCVGFLTAYGERYGAVPVITSYNAPEYNAHMQNWDVATDKSGKIHIGNTRGLLTYDGGSWILSHLPRGTIVRSLFTEGGRVYVGSFEDFGYFSPDGYGEMRYTSLVASRRDLMPENEEIWHIGRWGALLLFQSFAHIYWYNPNSGQVGILSDAVKPLPDTDGDRSTRFKPLKFYVMGGQLYAQRMNGGFYYYDKNGWRLVWSLQELGSSVRGIVPPFGKSIQDEGITDGTKVFTENGTVYNVEGMVLRPALSSLTRHIKDIRVNNVVAGPDSSIYIGTIGDGVLHIGRDGDLRGHISISNGLNNNTVLGMGIDRRSDLWTTLDDGVSVINFSLPYRIYLQSPQEHPLGMGYGVGRWKGGYMLATNHGAYCLTDKNEVRFELIPHTHGQNWFIRNVGQQSFIGGNEKTIVLDEAGDVAYENVSGTDIKRSRLHGKDVLLQSSYYDLLLYRQDEMGKWRLSHPVIGLNSPVRQLEIGEDGMVWCAHKTNGIIRLQVSPDLNSITDKTFFPNVKGDSIGRQCFIMKVRGKIVFSDGTGPYVFDEPSSRFSRYLSLDSALGKDKDIRSIEQVDDNRFWVVSPISYRLMEYSERNFHTVHTIPHRIFPLMSNGDNGCVSHEGNEILFTLNGGLGVCDMASLKSVGQDSTVTFSRLESMDRSGSRKRLPLDERQVTLQAPNLSVWLAYPDHRRGLYSYRFQIDGAKLDTVCKEPMHHFSILPWGRHTLRCGVLDGGGKEIAAVELKLKVLPPWPLRWWAIVGYVVILMVAVRLIVMYNIRRVSERQRLELEKTKAEADRQLQEQALVIAEQEKQLLESQLSSKSKELASIALSAYAKQQAIDDLRASMADHRQRGVVDKATERLLKDMSSHDPDSRMFWDIFEKNFDLIHEHFFRNLRKAYPSLTPVDLKFCALLRMNMTTKDISSFTNLSVRGVETARYRLRKKLSLSSEISLVQFLIDFSPSEDSQSEE